MRIACANWSRRRAGGIETYVEAILPGLRALGHDVAFWSERDDPADRACVQLPAGSASWCAAADGLDQVLDALGRWMPDVLFVHGLVEPAVERRLLEIAPAVFLAHSYYGTCISGGKALVFPSPRPCTRVFGPACLVYFYPRRCGGLSPVTMRREYVRQSERLALVRRYTTVLTLSEHMQAEYVRHGIERSRVRALPRFQPMPSAEITSTEHDGPVRVLFLGRLDRLKGCRLLLDALTHVQTAVRRPVHLVVAGDGPDRPFCEQRAAALAGNSAVTITFAGWVDAATRERLLGEASVFVLPSVWPEPYGLSGLEAIAAGVPVAAFASGGVPEWLHEGIEGALAPSDPPTANGLAAAIARCVRLGRRTGVSAEQVIEGQRQHLRALAAHLADAAGVRVTPALA
jgi:glycosyltransferase involved in cell wall biosynthesis